MAASTASPQRAIEVFFSYAHADEVLRNELAKHLSLLANQGMIAGWHDRQIPPGTEWADAISTHLESAQIILLLVSADFLASKYCRSYWIPGSFETSSSMSEPSNALPRFRTL